MAQLNLSIIIPHYNSLELLKTLIASIPECRTIEIIIVDDHSTNSTVEKLSSLQKSRHPQIQLLKNNTNKKGAGSARNKGLELAKGKYILFADADDYFVESAFDHIKKYYPSNNDIVFFMPTSISLLDNLPTIRHKHAEKIINLYLETGEKHHLYCFYEPWGKLFSRDFIKKNNLQFEEIIVSNDKLFSLQSSFLSKKYTVSEEVIYCVTLSDIGQSLTLSYSLENAKTRFNAAIRCNNYRIRNELPKDVVHYSLQTAYRSNKLYFLYALLYCWVNQIPTGIKLSTMVRKIPLTRRH